jgi:maleylacetoacetate isomerase
MKLATYWRSSAAYRVRIAFHLKGVSYVPESVDLTRGEQHTSSYRAKNPAGLVPALEVEEGLVLSQSLAVIEWLEETHPTPALLPREPLARAQVRAFALAVACDIHPLNNLRVLQYLKRTLHQDQVTIDAWYRHWLEVGLPVLEAMLQRAGTRGPFCFGDGPGLADICLVPQLANARRYDFPVDGFPRLMQADAAARALPAFQAAAPEAQPDAE